MKIRSVRFNVIMNFIYTVSSIIFPMITFPYVTRVLLVEGNGKVAAATSVITYLTMIASLGIPTYGIRACAKVREDARRLSKTVQELLIINTATTVVTYAVFLLLLFTVPQFQEEQSLYAVMSINMLLNVVGVSWLYSALEQYAYITVRSLVFKILSIILMFLFVKEPADYVVYGGITVFATSASNVLNFINIRKFVSLKPMRGEYDFRQHWKPIMIFFASSAATSVYTNLDTILLKFIQNDTEVGYYNAGIKIKTILITLVTSIGTVLLPRLSHYVQKKNMEEFRKIILMTVHFVIIFASAITVYFMIYARESILFLSGEAYEKAALPMFLLMPTVLFVGLSNITGIQILTPMGQEKKVLVSIVWGAAADILLNVSLCPFFGAAGTAFAGLAAELTVLLVQCWYLREKIRARIREISIGKILLSLLLASAVGIFLKVSLPFAPFPVLCCSAAAFFGSYAGMLILLREPFVWGLLKSATARIRGGK